MPETVKTRNSEVLADFVAYCQAHPEERFWQCLRNWACSENFLLFSTHGPWELKTNGDRAVRIVDTFSWEHIDG